MARPSKLTEKQWAEIERRHLKGEKTSVLAKEYKVGVQTIRDRVTVKNTEIKEVADQIVKAEQRFASLPVSVQVSVRTLADELKAISSNLASAASYGAATAHKLAKVAHIQANRMSELEDDEIQPEQLKGIAALTNLANQASNIGLGLIAATKGQTKSDNVPDQAKLLTDDELAAIIANGST